MNPDDIMLRRPDPKPSKSSIPEGDLLQAPLSFFEKIVNWWDNLRIKPHAEIHLDKSDPEHRPGVMIGIKGTF